ncbi:MAG: histidine phosphatase family protein [Hyphomicrobiaceae bacterium]|nr:histidine phosphatase family protein [Hyphomicrobiaceae bacterium]
MRDDVTLYFIRHGETDWNAESRYQGQADIPLNARGRAQARRNGEALRAHLPGLASADFVASPLSRTRETMSIVRAALELPPSDFRTDERLIELHYGNWEGRLLSDLRATDADALQHRQADPFNWHPEGGESFADLTIRLTAFLATVTRDTVIASHGGVSRALRCHLLGIRGGEVLDLAVPQDRVLIIAGGRMSWL